MDRGKSNKSIKHTAGRNGDNFCPCCEQVIRKPEVSLVVPVLNEEGNISDLYEQITFAMKGKYHYEVIFVDDGSSDNSLPMLRMIQRSDKAVRVVSFSKNFGQTAALSAGFDHARGEIIAALDADLQNDPADIPVMIERLREGYDIVSGWRKRRRDKALTRRLPSLIANWIIAKITGVRLHDFGCTLKVYRREVLEQTKLYGEMHRFIPALASWNGARICEMAVNHHPRTAGVAKYGLGRTLKVVLDLITVKFLGSFSTKPIHIFGGLGLISCGGATVCAVAIIYQKFISSAELSINRNPLLIVTAVLVTTTVQFVLMGLLAEMLVRTYHESQDRPTYVVRQIFESSMETEADDGQDRG